MRSFYDVQRDFRGGGWFCRRTPRLLFEHQLRREFGEKSNLRRVDIPKPLANKADQQRYIAAIAH